MMMTTPGRHVYVNCSSKLFGDRVQLRPCCYYIRYIISLIRSFLVFFLGAIAGQLLFHYDQEQEEGKAS